jgi:hypothetical protein
MKKVLVFLSLILLVGNSFSQTPGMIVEPATGSSAAILDPNGDGYISATTAGFLGNDQVNNDKQVQKNGNYGNGKGKVSE